MADAIFKPLEVFALNEMMNRCTGVIPYRSLIWSRRYHEPGEFSMVVPSNIYDPSWAYIYTDDRPETGIIQKVEFNDDSQVYGGIDSITVSGFFFESILNNITFLLEQPEEIKVAIPKPKRPYVLKSQSPKVYTDTVGGYYYTNSSGDMVDAETGNVVTGDGLVELDYKPIFGTGDWDPDTAHSNFDYTVDGDKSHITVVDYNGDINDYPTGPTGTYEVEFITDKGDTFYYNRYGNLTMAFGVANKVGNTYFAQVRAWEAGPKYKIVQVKGPWQRTDTMDPITEGDSIQMVFKWVQDMCGNNMLYEEPEIEGVTKKLDPSFQLLGDLAYSVLGEVGASYRVTYSFQQDVLVFSVYRGLDRTQEQTDMPWAVFSDTWGTITGYRASRDTSNYRNTCYVLYDYDKPLAFDETGWPVAGPIYGEGDYIALPRSYGIQYESKRGYHTNRLDDGDYTDREAYLDLREEKPSCDNMWSREIVELPGTAGTEQQEAIAKAEAQFARPEGNTVNMRAIYEAYEEDISKNRGPTYLREKYPIETVLDTGTVNTHGYMRDWDLGDKVELEVSTVGLVTTGRITEVEEVYESSGDSVKSSVNIVIGDKSTSATNSAATAAK